ncbi:hypothetical protein AAH021_05785 [Bacteroides thetaiotaomicron]|uniref:hypothetical protein n=1 Tax=Bacteroides thetaiotaomicron TaxID=818 RepID=UPI0039B4A670
MVVGNGRIVGCRPTDAELLYRLRFADNATAGYGIFRGYCRHFGCLDTDGAIGHGVVRAFVTSCCCGNCKQRQDCIEKYVPFHIWTDSMAVGV